MPASLDAAVPPPLPGGTMAGTSDTADGGLAYDGRLMPLIGLLLLNMLLSAVTLGIYRFWARTAVRRFFWGETRLLGDRLDYLGRGLELFLGFLIVIAILLPLAILFNVTVALLPPVAAGIANVAYVVVLAFLVNVAIWRARRYRLSRTAWRGVRAGQDGSAIGYALRAMGWFLAGFASLGLLHPVGRRALTRYRLTHTLFGRQRLRFDAPLGPLYRAWLPVWVVGLAALAGLGWAAFEGFALKTTDGMPTPMPKPGAAQTFLLPGLAAIAAFVLMGWYRTVEARLFANHTGLGEAGLDCRLHFGAVMGLWLAMWATGIGLVALVILAVGGFSFATALGVDGGGSIGGWQVGLILAPLLLLLLLGLLSTIFMGHWLWHHATKATRITNPQALERIAADGREGPRYGEGLADALEADVGVF